MKWLSGERKGVFYAISSGFCFGLLGYFGVTLMQYQFSVFNMLFWRFLVAAVVVGACLVPQYRQFSKQPVELAKVFIYGISFYSLTAILYFFACQTIGTGLSMVIFFTYPVAVILINRLLYKTIIPKMYYAAVGLVTVGMVFLAGTNDFTFDFTGILLGVASAITYALYVIASKHNTAAPLLSTFMVCVGSAVTCLGVALWEHSFFIPTELITWGHILAIGTLCTALPILLLLKALEYITPEKASLLSVLEPVFVLVAGVVLLDESLTLLQMVGVVIVLLGALMTLFGKRKKN